MKVLMVNKFLQPRGGAETYVLSLGKQLADIGYEVEYFGMDQPGRCVGNSAQAYTSNMDFHGGSKLVKLTYPFKTIYSTDARKKLRMVLEQFQPDVIHLNNFNYQLTPSVLVEADAWRRKTGHACRLIYTAHDLQLVCPNHLCFRVDVGKTCTECLNGKGFAPCIRHHCIHGSTARSVLGWMESSYWHRRKIYSVLDTIICCSAFLKGKLDTDPVLRKKTVTMHNFMTMAPETVEQKPGYVLYFGRYSEEKGLPTLLKAFEQMPDIPLVLAGGGPMEEHMTLPPNARSVGFQKGAALKKLVAEASFSICPSVCYENCPLSVMESIASGTPVIGARIGGIPELIEDGKTGLLFESGNVQELTKQIRRLWDDAALRASCEAACRAQHFDTAEEYARKLLTYYAG